MKIHSDSGHVGIGETDTNPWVAKAMIEAPGTHIMGLGLKETLIGKDPRDVEGLWEKMYVGSAMTGRRGLGICAIGALDMALWDLVGKIEGKPCWQLLGGAANPAITPYASLLPEGDDLETYGRVLASGRWRPRSSASARPSSRSASRVPIPTTRCRSRTIANAPAWCATCRKAVGPEMMLMVDVAYAWRDWKEALRAIEMFADQDIYFVETPLPSDDVEGYAKLCQASPVRIALGEWQNTRFEFLRVHECAGRVDVVQPDVGRVGGLTEAKRVAMHARDRGLAVVPHCWKSAIGIAASAHLAAVAPTCTYHRVPAEASWPIRRCGATCAARSCRWSTAASRCRPSRASASHSTRTPWPPSASPGGAL